MCIQWILLIGQNWLRCTAWHRWAHMIRIGLQRAYEKSQVCCFVYRGTQLIGAGRALSDGDYFAFICDIVVLPEFQRQGIGTRIVNALSERSAAEKVLLACVIGQEDFYRKLGFLKHKSVMALYPNAEQYKEIGLLE